jgi:hypothetical protein
MRWIALVVLIVLAGVPQASAQSGERCFSETGQCISGRIRQFWEQNGGLPVFGFPIGPQQEQAVEGRTVQAQNFEHNRLELHPQNQAPYDVLLGRLGADRLAQQGRDWQTAFAKSEPQANCRFFAETGHSICGTILAGWRAGGLEIDGRAGKTEAENLALFGLPLSDLVTETSSDGKQYQLQWFERARFELHPENQPPYNLLLGLLGNELRDNGGATPTPPAASAALTITGHGPDVTDPVMLPAPVTRVVGSHRAGDGRKSHNFAVWAYVAGTDERDLLFNVIGDHDGVRRLASTRPVYFEVTADGDWSLTIEPLPQQPEASGGISGRGQFVSGYFQPHASRVTYAFSHGGTRNFAVWLYCAGGREALPVNQIGNYEGEAVVEFGRGPCYWAVEADGDWTITAK